MYDCQPITAWMLGTLIPVAVLFFFYFSLIERWAIKRHPRLIDDMNRRKLFQGGMTVTGLLGAMALWGFLLEALCKA